MVRSESKVEIVLIMSMEEARILKALVQNPMTHDPEVGELCKSIFNALDEFKDNLMGGN
uniref:Uncharacterized protein n=1 Tax=viral metagenome TaxID=1070528 RepID=A0A6M3IDC6_9ZZZZ